MSGFLKCTYLKERIGQTFQGLITPRWWNSAASAQILDDNGGRLAAHRQPARDDQYVMENDGHAWRGRRNGRRLRTGARTCGCW